MAVTAQVDTGHGASITFATTAGTWKVRSITPGEKSVPMVDTTYLATTGIRTKMAGDLAEFTNPVVEFLFQGTQGVPACVANQASETITITFPIPSSGTAGATLAGTGIISKVTYPELKTNELQVGKIEWTWDGATQPAWTAAT